MLLLRHRVVRAARGGGPRLMRRVAVKGTGGAKDVAGTVPYLTVPIWATVLLPAPVGCNGGTSPVGLTACSSEEILGLI